MLKTGLIFILNFFIETMDVRNKNYGGWEKKKFQVTKTFKTFKKHKTKNCDLPTKDYFGQFCSISKVPIDLIKEAYL